MRKRALSPVVRREEVKRLHGKGVCSVRAGCPDTAPGPVQLPVPEDRPTGSATLAAPEVGGAFPEA